MNRRFDWEAHCIALGITRDELIQVAESERLPMRSLNQKQSTQLLKALKEYRVQKDSEAMAQQSLF